MVLNYGTNFMPLNNREILGLHAVTILESYFGQWAPTRKSELPVPLWCTWRCEPLLGSRCTTLIGFIGEALETITFYVFLRPHNGNFWTVATIYHNLQRTFFFTYVYKSLIWAPTLHASKFDKRCPNCPRIVLVFISWWYFC